MHWLWLSALIIAFDQASKWAAEALLYYHRPVAVLDFFNLTLTYNTGAAFSLLANAGGWQRWFFTLLATIVSVVLIVWLRRLPSEARLQGSAISLIIGGALGNAIDRVLYGHVIDFVDLHYAGWHWPAFNVADSAICIGAILLMLAPTPRRSEDSST